MLGLALIAGSVPASGQMAIPAAPDFGAVQGPSNSAILRCNGNDPAAAIAGCTAIIQSQQSRAQMRSAAFVNRGRAYYALGEKDRALGDFEAGVRADPKSSRALANRGAFYQAQGDLDRAVEDYTSAIAVNPRDIEAFNQRANVHMLNGDYDKAVADYDRAIVLNPRFAAGYTGRGEAYRVAGELDRAILDFERAIRLEPRLAIAFDKRGLVRSERARLRGRD